MVNDFVESLEEVFGNYKAGMKKAIIRKLSDITSDNEKVLYRALTEDYDMARPPSLKAILTTMYNHNIKYVTHHKYICSVCENCGKEFSANSLYCPHCKKLRKYGVIRMLEDKPPWHGTELAQMKKDEMELEDEHRKLNI